MSDYDVFDDYEADQPATLEEERPAPPPSERRGLSIFDLLAGLFALATIGFVVWTVLIIQNPNAAFNPFPPATTAPTATLFFAAEATASAPPTWTASPSPTEGPSPTPPATATATNTPKPTATGITPLPGATNTAAVYPFTLQDEVVTYARYQGAAGCEWQSIAGQVFDLLGNAVPQLPVEVTGDDISTSIAFTGSATQYGASGYEVKLSETPAEAEYVVRLLATTGMPLSEPIIVRTLATCDSNVAIVNFVQNHPLSP